MCRVDPDRRNRYMVLAMQWSRAKTAGEEEEAGRILAQLRAIEKELAMSPEEILKCPET